MKVIERYSGPLGQDGRDLAMPLLRMEPRPARPPTPADQVEPAQPLATDGRSIAPFPGRTASSGTSRPGEPPACASAQPGDRRTALRRPQHLHHRQCAGLTWEPGHLRSYPDPATARDRLRAGGPRGIPLRIGCGPRRDRGRTVTFEGGAVWSVDRRPLIAVAKSVHSFVRVDTPGAIEPLHRCGSPTV